MLREYFRHVAGFSPTSKLFLTAQFLYGIGQSAMWVLRNLYLKEAGFEEAVIGQTLSASAIGMAVVVLAIPPLMDRMTLRFFQVIGTVLLAGGLVGIVYVHGVWGALACCFVSGVGTSLLEVGTAPFFVRHSTPQERPYLFGVGTALSPAAGLVATLGMKAGAMVWGENLHAYGNILLWSAGATLLAILPLALTREAPPEPPGREDERFDWRTASRFFLPEVLFGLGAGLTIPFINLYFRMRFQVPVGTVGLYYAWAQALMMVAFLGAPLIARRLGAVRTIVLFQMTSIPFFLTLAWTTSLPLAVAMFLLRHACMNMIHPVGANFAMDVVHPRQRARVNGLKQLANKLAWVVATWTGGAMIDRVGDWKNRHGLVDGFTVTMLITIVLYLIGSAMYWKFFSKEPAGRVPAPEAEPTAGA
jgi:MFS family permease